MNRSLFYFFVQVTDGAISQISKNTQSIQGTVVDIAANALNISNNAMGIMSNLNDIANNTHIILTEAAGIEYNTANITSNKNGIMNNKHGNLLWGLSSGAARINLLSRVRNIWFLVSSHSVKMDELSFA